MGGAGTYRYLLLLLMNGNAGSEPVLTNPAVPLATHEPRPLMGTMVCRSSSPELEQTYTEERFCLSV